MEYAYIEYRQHVIEPYGIKYTTYKWVGSKNALILLSPDIDIKTLPFSLVKVRGGTLYTPASLYARTDTFFPVWMYYKIKHVMDDAWKWFYYRVIMTLNVWGLAYTDIGAVPSWRDICRKNRGRHVR